MLYLTTRNTSDAYTAHRALKSDLGPDGGSFVPFRIPVFSDEQLFQLKEKTFNEIVAELINSFFSLHLSGWDLDFGVGRNLVRTVPMNHRIIVAELWHNLGGDFAYIEDSLCKKIAAEAGVQNPANWSRLAIKIAVIFGIYGQLLHDSLLNINEPLDFSVANDDFHTPIAILYCKKMGLPVNMVICTCDEKHNLWDFINRGTLNTADLNRKTQVNLERLLHLTVGCDSTVAFSTACQNRSSYSVAEDALPNINSNLFCSVAGKDRSQAVINSLYRTNSYITDVESALCYGGLQDYRAKIGNSQLTVILAEKTPARCLSEISAATGLLPESIMDIINKA